MAPAAAGRHLGRERRRLVTGLPGLGGIRARNPSPDHWAFSRADGEPAWRGLIARLSEASPEFVRVWEERQVRGPENQTKLIMNERVGPLRLESTYYWLGPRPGPRVAVYTPADSDSRERLEKLAADL